MLSILDHHWAGDRIARREWLRVGGLSALGLSLPQLLQTPQARASTTAPASLLSGELGATFGKAKNVIFLWLQGGPPQHETFDPKPEAPLEIRGPFKPISTNVSGVHYCELLPRTSQYADKLAVVRSCSTRDDNHDVSGYWLLTGYPYGPGSARQIKPNDWPYFGSIVKMLKPSEKLPALTSVWIPDVMRLNDNVTPAGQTAGFLGKLWEPERFVGDPALPDYAIEGLALPGEITRVRMDRRRDLLGQLESQLGQPRLAGAETWDRLSQQAFELITSGTARAAFDLSRESDQTRDRYGRYTWGQSVLLARRLIEAGVRLVHVNWARDPGDNAVDNPMWDTHTLNADRLQDNLCPQFDPTFAALMDDLAERGLLDDTLVVIIGEFGRTPKINPNGGRDHWGHVFSFARAGAGIRGGQVIGASDKNGAYPATNPITGGDLTATIFHLLGIDAGGVFHDRENRPHPITKGEPIEAMLAGAPAPLELRKSEGDPSLVPPFDTRLLFDTAFDTELPLVPVEPVTRDKGWRGWPLRTGAPNSLAVSKEPGAALLGYRAGNAAAPITVEAGARALLVQEIRNARGGQYTMRVQAQAIGTTEADYQQFLGNFRCRLVIFRFRDIRKDPREAGELASLEFRPTHGKSQEFVLDRFLGSTTPGANFPIGAGLGVMICVEKHTPGTLTINGDGSNPIGLRVESVQLTFNPRQRDESVTV
ncbi:MAG TPA: DUF1501 domain-containing protein [Planctomycetaceae bacterium]|nr:DUF1501 domain-containing protein [Planctomycetaceae bacterium]